MHCQPNTINMNALAIEAIELMETKKINGLLVTNESGVLVGAFNMHDLILLVKTFPAVLYYRSLTLNHFRFK